MPVLRSMLFTGTGALLLWLAFADMGSVKDLNDRYAGP